MMVLKLWLMQIERFFNGSYVINRSKGIFVSSKANALEKLYSFSEALGGISVAGIELKLQFNNLIVNLPFQGKVQVYSALGWRTIWNGSDPVYSNNQSKNVSFSFKSNVPLRLVLNGQSTLVSLLDNRRIADFFPKVPTFSELLYIIQNLGKSFLAHLFFGLSIVFIGSFLSNHFQSTDVDLSKEQTTKKEDLIPIEIPVEVPMKVADDQSLVDSKQTKSIKHQQTVEEKSQKIVSKLSNVAMKMSKMSIGGLNNVTETKNLSDANLVVNSLKDKLGMAQKVDLKGNFQVVGQGSVGGTSFWNVVSSKEKVVSSKELEEVASFFRALQDQIRGCYESALLHNEKLSVTVHYEALVLESGHLGDQQFVASGNSDKKSEDFMFGCIGKVLKQIKLSNGLKGVKIRNQFIFKS